MGLKKGMTNNKNGRPKGKPNRVTAETREFISNLLDKNQKQIEKDLKNLEPFERIRMYEKFLSYILPKKTESDLKINPDNMSDQDIKRITDELLKNI